MDLFVEGMTRLGAAFMEIWRTAVIASGFAIAISIIVALRNGKANVEGE